MATAAGFAERLRTGGPAVGYWSLLGCAPAVERLGRLGFDFVTLDAQHGLVDPAALVSGLTAIDAAGGAVGLVRVASDDPAGIGRALDAGAAGVIVPMIETSSQAESVAAAARYPPVGTRSWGPMRSELRIGPDPDVANRSVVVLAMIETARGLTEVEAIAATPGVDGLLVGPVDLALALGIMSPGDPAMEDALARVRAACSDAGVPAGIHTPSGAVAAQRLAEGFGFVSIGMDLAHLEAAAADHLVAARG